MRRTLETAVRGPARALAWGARAARSLLALARRRRGDGPRASATPRPDPEDAAFLNEVSETLRRLEVSGESGPPPPGSATARGRLRSAAAWLRRLREPLRRNEDVLLAAALLLGILVMVAHWRLSRDVHVPLRAERNGAASARPDSTRREPLPPQAGPEEADAATGAHAGSRR